MRKPPFHLFLFISFFFFWKEQLWRDVEHAADVGWTVEWAQSGAVPSSIYWRNKTKPLTYSLFLSCLGPRISLLFFMQQQTPQEQEILDYSDMYICVSVFSNPGPAAAAAAIDKTRAQTNPKYP